ncbi:uncharacterized protein CTRU02_206380 [Colletotrichum truncatum]|uniref:Uncharacterized protein n=1 Tax=Colletotrichum truncatum TaxID=5467 RepID=A0ACC3Z6T3_COLTU|nr:uncharacterized protein CTRU02_09784 [Colletotrichum truncatum]KAF6787971.1 hypothetical protein CTRU02_09784 [Colletotrichum truncatum]
MVQVRAHPPLRERRRRPSRRQIAQLQLLQERHARPVLCLNARPRRH